MTASLISIIIPCFKQARYLAEAIQSVLDQNYPAKEIIVINDGSPDNTQEVARNFGDAVTYIEQENKGVSAARNAGVRKAQGAYIAFLDSDDLLLPNSLAIRAEYLDTHPDIALVCGDAEIFDEHGTLGLQSTRSGRPSNPANFRWETVEYYPVPSNVMLRRTCFDKVMFDEQLRSIGEDWLLWAQLSRFFNMAFIDVPVTRYRVHQENATSMIERINRSNRLAVALLADSSGFEEYPAHWRARFLFYRFATTVRVGSKQAAFLYLIQAFITDPRQLGFGIRQIYRGISNVIRRYRDRQTRKDDYDADRNRKS